MTDDLVLRHGSAKHPRRGRAHERPEGMSDASVEALGKLSEALEVVEHARGNLYAFHRLGGRADLTLQQAVEALRDAEHGDLANEMEEVLVGRDVMAGRWTFEIVEDYDAGYWTVFRDVERTARERLGDAAPHLFEADMKHEEQAAGD